MTNHPNPWFQGRTERGTRQNALAPDPAWVLAHTSKVELDDRTEVMVRPILPGDKHHLVSLLKRMSLESRHLRFHHVKHRFSKAELRYLTELDYHDHFALVAFVAGESGPFAVGVARYIRVAPMSDHAEVAATVVDQYQGRGLGKTLLDLVMRAALEHGVAIFVGYVEPANVRVISWVRRAGGTFVGESGVLRFELRPSEISAKWPLAAGESVPSSSAHERQAA